MENTLWAPPWVCDPAQVSKSQALGAVCGSWPGWDGAEGAVSVWIALNPRPQRDPGAVSALSCGRDPEVLPRCQGHAGLHPRALLEAVLGCHQPSLAGSEYPRLNYGQGHHCPSGHPAGQQHPSAAQLPVPWITPLSLTRGDQAASRVDRAVGPHASPPHAAAPATVPTAPGPH